MTFKRKIRVVLKAVAGSPFRVKVVLFFSVLYLLSPIDLIPDFIPVIGQLDDLLVISLVTKYVKKHLPNLDLKDIDG
jgi:uncharacterized membrane protein YkvA (DUF1232 family)